MDGPSDCYSKQNETSRKSQELSDFTQMWDKKLKVTREQDRQKLTDTDDSLVVTGWKGRASGRGDRGSR